MLHLRNDKACYDTMQFIGPFLLKALLTYLLNPTDKTEGFGIVFLMFANAVRPDLSFPDQQRRELLAKAFNKIWKLSSWFRKQFDPTTSKCNSSTLLQGFYIDFIFLHASFEMSLRTIDSFHVLLAQDSAPGPANDHLAAVLSPLLQDWAANPHLHRHSPLSESAEGLKSCEMRRRLDLTYEPTFEKYFRFSRS